VTEPEAEGIQAVRFQTDVWRAKSGGKLSSQ